MENNNTPREGWADAFKKMHENGDDELLIPDVFEDEIFPKYWENPEYLAKEEEFKEHLEKAKEAFIAMMATKKKPTRYHNQRLARFKNKNHDSKYIALIDVHYDDSKEEVSPQPNTAELYFDDDELLESNIFHHIGALLRALSMPIIDVED